jgi:hypothetical protein
MHHNGNSLWDIARRPNAVELMKAVIDGGVPEDNEDWCNEEVFFSVLCSAHRGVLLRMVLDAGANAMLVDTDGETVLTHRYCSDEIVEVVLKHIVKRMLAGEAEAAAAEVVEAEGRE